MFIPGFTVAALLALSATGCGSDDTNAEGDAEVTIADDKGDAAENTLASDEGEGEDENDGKSDSLDICSMVSDAEVQASLGEPAKATDQSTGDLYACSWEGEGDALNVLSVSVYVHPDAETAKQQYDATSEGLEGSDLMGLGDEASYNESFGLEVLSDRYDISVDNTGPTEKESDIAIAQRILAQLP